MPLPSPAPRLTSQPSTSANALTASTPQVARLFHSYAVAAHPHAALASTLAHAARQRIDDSTPDQMTSVLSSCITLGLAPPPHLLQDVSAWAQPRIDAFTPGQLAVLAKALAAHSFYDRALACRIAAASTARAAEFAPLQVGALQRTDPGWPPLLGRVLTGDRCSKDRAAPLRVRHFWRD